VFGGDNGSGLVIAFSKNFSAVFLPEFPKKMESRGPDRAI
jgi:hypothetical protein